MNRQTESEIYGGIFTHGHKVEIPTIQLMFSSSLKMKRNFYEVAVLLSVRMIFHFDKCLNSLNVLIELSSAHDKNEILSYECVMIEFG